MNVEEHSRYRRTGMTIALDLIPHGPREEPNFRPPKNRCRAQEAIWESRSDEQQRPQNKPMKLTRTSAITTCGRRGPT